MAFLKEIRHELLADEIDYMYLKYSGRENLNSIYVNGSMLKQNEKTNKEDSINKGLASFHKASEFWFVIKGTYSVNFFLVNCHTPSIDVHFIITINVICRGYNHSVRHV